MNRFSVIGILAIAGLIAFSAWWHHTIWNECRDAGHSFMYCYHTVFQP